MMLALFSDNEAERQAALLRYDILGTEAEAAYDDLVEMAAHICDTPIALISLIDRDRQWFKSTKGLGAACETSRDHSFCGHAIHEQEIMVVPDATKDLRFYDNPYVLGEPYVRFYAGAPLVTPDGYALGTICVIDSKPHHLNDEQKHFLSILARQVMANMQLRLNFKELQTYAQELHYASASKDKLFSVISHDLKAPFNGIIGLSDILMHDIETLDVDTIQEFANDINQSAETALALLTNLLQWSRLERGHLVVQPSAIAIRDIVKSCQTLLVGAARDKGIQIVSDISPNTVVWADFTMLQSVIQNLLSNAIKFTPAGGTVTIKAYSNAASVTLAVSDTGVGMTPRQLECLFRIDNCQSTQGTAGEAGTGLGLLLCHQFVERNHGSLTVQSSPGEGSTFRLELPMPAMATLQFAHGELVS